MPEILKPSDTAGSAKRISWFRLITIRQFLFWVAIFVVTRHFMSGADHFLQLTPEALGKYFNYKWVLIAHITGGGGALVLGPLQFWSRFRARYIKLHRWVGVGYLLAILVSSICAVILSFTTVYDVNWAYAFSAQVWVSVWIISTVIAYRAALQKKFKLHQEWMTRSYIVTLAFIVSGLTLKFLLKIGFGTFEAISPSLFWMGWSVPLFIYQVVLSWKANK
ncbi:DUF2306 domain-containing protein [Niastella caeni]|uniref:DUF2306 domain-containing protein n=1 Tax=Niastella caeni TaxID=2569763 RepID=A0A4S8HD64_9BACT|nr:DUF2306 domain-containing protein [Niastella caeni]THU32970.1 DUF2306 domain-containing protein [Niastella caeni]